MPILTPVTCSNCGGGTVVAIGANVSSCTDCDHTTVY